MLVVIVLVVTIVLITVTELTPGTINYIRIQLRGNYADSAKMSPENYTMDTASLEDNSGNEFIAKNSSLSQFHTKSKFQAKSNVFQEVIPGKNWVYSAYVDDR